MGYNEKVTLLLKNAFKLDNGKALPIVPCIGKVVILLLPWKPIPLD